MRYAGRFASVHLQLGRTIATGFRIEPKKQRVAGMLRNAENNLFLWRGDQDGSDSVDVADDHSTA